MSPSMALQEEYRRCLERDFCQGRPGVCVDLSLKESLRQCLLETPELLCALQGDDAFAVLGASLRGQHHLPAALRNLSRAFEVLELAAVNLYLFPWRKEFSTIKTFSGVYVHVLQGALSEADILRSFHSLGYAQRDDHHLALSQPPPGSNLLRAACGFLAARVECEILGDIVARLGPGGVSAQELLRVRRDVGGLEGCVAELRRLAPWPRGRGLQAEPAPSCGDGIDLYRGGSEPAAAKPESHPRAPPIWEHSPRLWGEQHPPGASESGGRSWLVPDQEQPYANGVVGCEETSPETSFSFISLRRELSKASGSDSAGSPEGRFLSASPCYDSPCCPASPSGRRPRTPEHSPAATRRKAPGLSPGSATPEPPRYQLHSCLGRGALPSCCCVTCRWLHAGSCAAAQLCRSSHQVQELQSEKQQRLWLQRMEVEALLHEGTGDRL
uniref:Spermatosis associated 2 like n=1 Tax=Sphenodon punctatus TaxID=8508 RepID=A0A8D0GNQ6_SPHPU